MEFSVKVKIAFEKLSSSFLHRHANGSNNIVAQPSGTPVGILHGCTAESPIQQNPGTSDKSTSEVKLQDIPQFPKAKPTVSQSVRESRRTRSEEARKRRPCFCCVNAREQSIKKRRKSSTVKPKVRRFVKEAECSSTASNSKKWKCKSETPRIRLPLLESVTNFRELDVNCSKDSVKVKQAVVDSTKKKDIEKHVEDEKETTTDLSQITIDNFSLWDLETVNIENIIPGITAITSSFSEERQNRTWDPSETEKFYTALVTVGANLELMTNIMENRSSYELWKKLMIELRDNTSQVYVAVVYRIIGVKGKGISCSSSDSEEK